MSEEKPVKKPLTRRQLLKRGGLGVFALLAAGGTAEANVIPVTRHRVVLPGLGLGSKPLRVVQISDLHRGPLVMEGMIHRAVELANAQKPDLILVTGDFVSITAGYAGSCADIIAGLRAPLGVWGVWGNHDHWTDDIPRMQAAISRSGCRILTNANTQLSCGLRLVGIDDLVAGDPDVPRAFAGVPEDAPTLVMAHNPKHFRELPPHACVQLSGHTHGGQVNYPGRKAFMERKYGYCDGWYSRGQSKLYVNRGIGVVGVPWRILAPPEISVFDLVPA